jgi:glycosyltransferase involved in cell wall biosynthesis
MATRPPLRRRIMRGLSMATSTNASRTGGAEAPGSVLLVTPRWTRNGGVGAHVQASAAALAAHGLRVGVLAARVDAEQELPGVAILHSPELYNRDATTEARLGEAGSFAAEVIHLHQFDHPEVVSAMRAMAPIVNSAHAYSACSSGVHYFRPGHECSRAHGPGCVPNLLLRGCLHNLSPRTLPSKYERATRALLSLRIADLAVVYSSAVDRHLAANGVERRATVPLFATMIPGTGSGHATRRRVTFAGRIVRPKGVHVLIRAAREVDAEFVICGDGRDLADVRRLARRLGVQDRVRFTGWLDAADLAHELAEASVVAIPSVWPEPFGLVGIEALAAGRPVVASATGGTADWLDAGETGLCVAPGDAVALARALNELLQDPERQARMGAAGRAAVAARFSRERHVEGLVRAYRMARSNWESGAPGSP